MNSISFFVVTMFLAFQTVAAEKVGALFAPFYGSYKVESCRNVKPTKGEDILQGCERKFVQVHGKPGAALYTDIVLSGDASKNIDEIAFGMVNQLDDSNTYLENGHEFADLKNEYLSNSGNLISEILMKDAGQGKVSLRFKSISFGWKLDELKEIQSYDVEWILIPVK